MRAKRYIKLNFSYTYVDILALQSAINDEAGRGIGCLVAHSVLARERRQIRSHHCASIGSARVKRNGIAASRTIRVSGIAFNGVSLY